jgi:hypothetical protein
MEKLSDAAPGPAIWPSRSTHYGPGPRHATQARRPERRPTVTVTDTHLSDWLTSQARRPRARVRVTVKNHRPPGPWGVRADQACHHDSEFLVAVPGPFFFKLDLRNLTSRLYLILVLPALFSLGINMAVFTL